MYTRFFSNLHNTGYIVHTLFMSCIRNFVFHGYFIAFSLVNGGSVLVDGCINVYFIRIIDCFQCFAFLKARQETSGIVFFLFSWYYLN